MHNEFMSKKIDTALKDLVHALERHAQIVGMKPVPQKKAGRAAAELRAAASAYATVVEDRTGQSNPFIDVLDTATIDSLIHERDRVAQKTVADKAARDAKDARKASKKAEKATGGSKSAKTDAGTDPKSATPSQKAPAKSSPADILTPPIPAGFGSNDLHAETLISLRTLAKARGLVNVSRLGKAALIERLEETQPHS